MVPVSVCRQWLDQTSPWANPKEHCFHFHQSLFNQQLYFHDLQTNKYVENVRIKNTEGKENKQKLRRWLGGRVLAKHEDWNLYTQNTCKCSRQGPVSLASDGYKHSDT